FDGRRVKGKLLRTLVRGETVYADGEIRVAPGHGRFLSSQEAHVLAPAGAAVAGLTAARGPRSVESAADHAVAAAEVVELVRVNPGHDAYLVACFDDPGVDAARELTEAPVVGIGEAAYRAACLVGRRFAVLTTLRRG